jgi:hypothetical protein
MEPVPIPCPKCGKVLRLRDHSLIGKKGKCPKCQNRFVLALPAQQQPAAPAPESVEFELAGSVPSATPQVGTAAKWVPDQPQGSAPFEAVATAPSPFPASAGSFSPNPASPQPFVGEEEGGAARLREIQRKSAKRRNIGIVLGGLVGLMIGGAVLAMKNYGEQNATNDEDDKPKVDQAWKDTKQDLKSNLEIAKGFSPTKGEPVKLLYIPAGANIVFNFRPSELWKDGSLGQECLFGLTKTFMDWSEGRIKELCGYEPAEIEEALICVHLGPRGIEPEYSIVVRLVRERTRSELVMELAGETTDEFGPKMFLDDNWAQMIVDTKTIAKVPRDLAQEMAMAMVNTNPTADGIEAILHHTDRDRHFNIVFQPNDLRIHKEFLVAEELHGFFDFFLDWLGDDVETVAWSAQLGENFYSDMKLRGSNATTPTRLQREIRGKLDDLPFDFLAAAEKMEPKTVGARSLIGRYPAMMQAVSLQTLGGISDTGRFVQMTTLLPERAAPNLAAGTMFFIREALVTDFTKAAPTKKEPTGGAKVPELLADRLKQIKIEIEFNRTPLYAAFDYIGEEIKTKIEIDGDALKAKGMTQNMAQSQNLGVVPAIEGVHAILKRYERDGMVIIVQQDKKQILVTTKEAAKAQGLKAFPTGK